MKNSIFKLFLAVLALANLSVGFVQAAGNSKKFFDTLRGLNRLNKQVNRADDGSSSGLNIFTSKPGGQSIFSHNRGFDGAIIAIEGQKNAAEFKDYDITQSHKKDAKLQSQDDAHHQVDQSHLSSQSVYAMPLMQRLARFGAQTDAQSMKDHGDLMRDVNTQSKEFQLSASSYMPVLQHQIFTQPTEKQLLEQMAQKRERLAQARQTAENGWFWQRSSAQKEVESLDSEITQLTKQLTQITKKEARDVLPGLRKFHQNLKQKDSQEAPNTSSSSADLVDMLSSDPFARTNSRLQEFGVDDTLYPEDYLTQAESRMVEKDHAADLQDISVQMRSELEALLKNYKTNMRNANRISKQLSECHNDRFGRLQRVQKQFDQEFSELFHHYKVNWPITKETFIETWQNMQGPEQANHMYAIARAERPYIKDVDLVWNPNKDYTQSYPDVVRAQKLWTDTKEQFADAQQTVSRIMFGPQDENIAQSSKPVAQQGVVQQGVAPKKEWQHPAYITQSRPKPENGGLERFIGRDSRTHIHQQTFKELNKYNMPKAQRSAIRKERYSSINKDAIEHARTKGASQFNPEVLNAFKQKYVQTKQPKQVQTAQPQASQLQEASQSRALVPVKQSENTYDATPQLSEALKAFLKRTQTYKADNVVDLMQEGQTYMPLIASQSSTSQVAQVANQQSEIKHLFGVNHALLAKIKKGNVAPTIIIEYQPAGQSQAPSALKFESDEQNALVSMQSEKQAGIITIHAQNKDGFIDTLTIDLAQLCPQDLANIQKLMQALNIDLEQPTQAALFNDQQKDVAMLGHQTGNELISFNGDIDDAQMPEITTSVFNHLAQLFKDKNTVGIQFDITDVNVKSFDTLRSAECNTQDRRSIAGPSSQNRALKHKSFDTSLRDTQDETGKKQDRAKNWAEWQKRAQEFSKKRKANAIRSETKIERQKRIIEREAVLLRQEAAKKQQVQVKKQTVQKEARKAVQQRVKVESPMQRYAQSAKTFKARAMDRATRTMGRARKFWYGPNNVSKQVARPQQMHKAGQSSNIKQQTVQKKPWWSPWQKAQQPGARVQQTQQPTQGCSSFARKAKVNVQQKQTKKISTPKPVAVSKPKVNKSTQSQAGSSKKNVQSKTTTPAKKQQTQVKQPVQQQAKKTVPKEQNKVEQKTKVEQPGSRVQQMQKPTQVRSSFARKVARKPKVNAQQKQTKNVLKPKPAKAPKQKTANKRTTQPQAKSNKKSAKSKTTSAKKQQTQVKQTIQQRLAALRRNKLNKAVPKQTQATITTVQLPQQKTTTGALGIDCGPTINTTNNTQQPQVPPTYTPGPSYTPGPHNNVPNPLSPLQLFLLQYGLAIIKAIQDRVLIDPTIVVQAEQHVKFFGGMLTAYNNQCKLVQNMHDQANSNVLAGRQNIGQTVLKMIAQNIPHVTR